MSVYKLETGSKANRIEGRVETGSVDHSRRKRALTGSRYKVGKARSGGFSLSHPIGGSYLSFASRSRTNSR